MPDHSARAGDGATPDLPSNVVDDGVGGAWMKCVLDDCDLHVVRPGKVQCSDRCEALPFDERYPDG